MKTEQLMEFLISPDNTVVEAMQHIDRNAKGILFVVEENQKLIGVVTDGDIRRWLIKNGDLQAQIQKFMTRSPKLIYRKDVKQLLNNLLSWIDDLSIDDLLVDRPNHSQRVRYINRGV